MSGKFEVILEGYIFYLKNVIFRKDKTLAVGGVTGQFYYAGEIRKKDSPKKKIK